MKKILYVIGMVVLFVGCSKESSHNSIATESHEQVTVSFGASLLEDVSDVSSMWNYNTPITRAQGAFTSAYTGCIGILRSDGNWENINGNWENINLAIALDGSITTTPEKVVIVGGDQYKFCSIAVPSDKSSPEYLYLYNYYVLNPFVKESEGTDLIYATTTQVASVSNPVHFAYNHVYGKVKFVLIPGEFMTEETLSTAKLSVSGYYTKGSLNTKTGEITGLPGINVPVDRDEVYYLIPQTFTSSTIPTTVTARVSLLGKIYVGKITKGDIVANKLTTITIKVTGDLVKPGYYSYQDGTFSAHYYDGSENPCVGVVYKVNSEGTEGMIVSLAESMVSWSLSSISTHAGDWDNGQVNFDVIQNYIKDNNKSWDDFPAHKFCKEMSTARMTGWYLPSVNEVEAIYNAYNANRTVFNNIMSSANGAVFGDVFYRSSSEQSATSAWGINFGDGARNNENKGYTLSTRCVRAFGKK